MFGNCLERMKELRDASIDLVVTSPPYDNLRTYNNTLKWDFEIFKNVANELKRLIKNGGVIVWVVGDATIKGSETGTSFKQALYFKEIGLNLHDTMIYAKNNYMPLTHNRYEQAFEFVFIISKGRPKTFNPIMIPSVTAGTKKFRGSSKSKDINYSERCRDEKTIVQPTKQHPNIFFYTVGQNDRTNHPAPFPEKLVNDHIITWSVQGDTVLDPFMGSGTTGKIAKLLKRDFIGIECVKEYFRIAKQRIKNT